MCLGGGVVCLSMCVCVYITEFGSIPLTVSIHLWVRPKHRRSQSGTCCLVNGLRPVSASWWHQKHCSSLLLPAGTLITLLFSAVSPVPVFKRIRCQMFVVWRMRKAHATHTLVHQSNCIMCDSVLWKWRYKKIALIQTAIQKTLYKWYLWLGFISKKRMCTISVHFLSVLSD